MFINIILVGILSCAILDFWQRLLLAVLGIAPTNWGLVGRWFILFIKTQVWINNGLSEQSEKKNELAVGWIFHYTVSISYAGLFVFLWTQKIVQAGFTGGLLFGIISVIVPWFFFMPALGAGVLGTKTESPIKACVLAFLAHAIYGTAIGILVSVLF